MNIRPLSLLRLWLMLSVVLPVAVAPLAAQTEAARFVRLGSADAVTPGARYIVSSIDEFGVLRYLSASISSNKKAVTYKHSAGPEAEVTCTEPLVIWTLEAQPDGQMALRHSASGKYLQRLTNGALGLTLTASPDGRAAWTLERLGHDAFVLRDATADNRALQLRGDKATAVYFDNYTYAGTPQALYLYRELTDFTHVQGPNVQPAVGSQWVLAQTGRVRTAQGAAADATDCLLANGTLCPSQPGAAYTVQAAGSEGYALQADDGTYLGYDLMPQTQPAAWLLERGKWRTAEAQPRYLCTLPNGEWQTLDADAATRQGASPAVLCALADAPTSALNAQGVLRLQGGWSASALAAVSFKGVRCLDLTPTSLPLAARAFEQEAETPNLPVFVPAAEQSVVPAAWPFVVACGAEGHALLTTVQLVDRAPFFTDRPFQVQAGQMTYSREGWHDANFQTLCLPFPATVSPDFSLYVTTGCDADRVLFDPVSATLPACTPCLVRYRSASAYGSSCAFQSAAGTVPVTPSQAAAGLLRGTFAPCVQAADATTVYYLHAAGTAFVLPAAGSRLSPFRAMLVTEGQASPRRPLRIVAKP